MKGTFKARGVAGTFSCGESSEKKTKGVSGMFEITEGPHQGEQVPWSAWLSDKAVERTLEALMLCGWEGNDITRLDGCDRNDVLIVVEEEEFVGRDGVKRMTSKVKWVNDPERTVGVKPLDQATALTFAEQMRGKIAELRAKKKTEDFPHGANAPAPGVKF